MKLGIIGLLAIILSGCGLLNGYQNGTVEEAYYTPVILSDRSSKSGRSVQISDRARGSQTQYEPVITP